MEKIVIVMPAYNEAENIGLMIKALLEEEFPKIKNAEMHLLVVDDYSPDQTGQVVKENAKKYPQLHLLQKPKEGLGWAYVRGFQYAITKLSADAVMEMDADFQHPPRFVKPMVEAYLGGADYVIGSRYVKGGSIPKEWALFRKFWSYFGNLYARLVLMQFSLHDLTTGFRLTKVKGVLDKVELEKLMELDRFAYKIDLLFKTIKVAKRVTEVPLQFVSRSREKSKFNPKEAIASFKIATILGIKDKIRFLKFGTVGFVGYLVNALTLELFSKSQIVSDLAAGLAFTRGTVFSLAAQSASWAAALATEMAIISNFIFNNLWTFSEAKISKPLKLVFKFLQFNLTSLGAVVIQFVVIGLAVKFFGDTRTVRQIGLLAGLPLVLSFNYTMYNLVIWKTWRFPKRNGEIRK
jgi:dolichol-phosphate mannosyltransferase